MQGSVLTLVVKVTQCLHFSTVFITWVSSAPGGIEELGCMTEGQAVTVLKHIAAVNLKSKGENRFAVPEPGTLIPRCS